MTKPEWEKELASALKVTGWIVFSAGCAQDSSSCFADLSKGDISKHVNLSRDTFSTPETRKKEILRQVSR